MFSNSSDYSYFLNKYQYYLFLAVETYAFCLLRNHIHVLVRIRSLEEQKALYEKLNTKISSDLLHGLGYKEFKPYSASIQFGDLLNSYTKHYNRNQERSGVLFDGRFKRVVVDSEEYLTQLICYIHRNPIHHGIETEYSSYLYSSYNEILSEEKTILNRRKVLEFFGGKENFKEAHKEFKMKLDTRFFLEN